MDPSQYLYYRQWNKQLYLLCAQHCEEISDHSTHAFDDTSSPGEQIVEQMVSRSRSTHNGLYVKALDKLDGVGDHVRDWIGEVRTSGQGKMWSNHRELIHVIVCSCLVEVIAIVLRWTRSRNRWPQHAKRSIFQHADRSQDDMTVSTHHGHRTCHDVTFDQIHLRKCIGCRLPKSVLQLK